MSNVRPFRPLRPTVELASQVASPPYDVVNREEARAIAEGNPHCFLRVGRADLELGDEIDAYSTDVYRRGAANLTKLVESGALFREAEPILGVYRQVMGEHVQEGIVGLASVDEYDRGLIKKHEFTKPDKETDRATVIDIHNSQSGPVFLTYRQTEGLRQWFAEVTAEPAEIAFTADDGVQHTVWVVRDSGRIGAAQDAFESVPALYIADGHHRSAAASRVWAQRGGAPGPADGFLTVIFPHDRLNILPYNRVVRGLNGHTPEDLLAAVAEHFDLTATDDPGTPAAGGFDVYLEGAWHRATPKVGVVPSDPVGSLAVSVLTAEVLKPILGIEDQRTDNRIDFVGGIRGVAELERRVDNGDWSLAFALYPTSVAELLAVADAGEIMPPKSTWFEPKLRDGLFVHVLDDRF